MSSPRQTAEAILSQIYAEKPAHWPHGLSMDNYDTGKGEGVFLVRAKQANMEPVGFVGWQERRENGERIGYYSVGVLPEHRGQGYAKEAVAKLINIKAARVDRVIALIEKGNAPSKALANSLGLQIKQAGTMKSLMSMIGKGTKATRRAMVGDTARTLGAGALGAGVGMAESHAVPGSGHVAETGLPLTNAIMAMVLANPRMRKDFFGSSAWRDLDTKKLTGFIGAKALTNAGILGADQFTGLMGKAQEAATGLGNAGSALTNVSKAVEESTRGVTSEINKAAPRVAQDVMGITGGLSRATSAAGDDLPALFKGLGDAGSKLPELAENAVKTTGNMDRVLDSADSTSSAIRDMSEAIKGLGQMKPNIAPETKNMAKQVGGIGAGALAGGMLGHVGSRLLTDDVPLEQTKKFNRNRRLRALITALGAGAGAYAGHKLS